MNEMVEFLTSKEIIVVYIVIGVACLLCVGIYLIDKNYDKRKRKQNTKKLNKLVEDVNLRLQEGIEEETKEENNAVINNVAPQFIEPQIEVAQNPSIENNYEDINSVQTIVEEPVNNLSVEEKVDSNIELMDAQINKVDQSIDGLIYTNPEPDKEEATRELLKLTEELEKAERAQKDGIDILAYENAQEENAIISLEELTKRSEEMYAANEATQYADEGNEPISLADLEKRKSQVINAEILEEPKEQVYQEQISLNIEEKNDGYKGTMKSSSKNKEIFSSVFGSLDNMSKNNNIQTEEELQKTSEFLLSLKELQSRLNS